MGCIAAFARAGGGVHAAPSVSWSWGARRACSSGAAISSCGAKRAQVSGGARAACSLTSYQARPPRSLRAAASRDSRAHHRGEPPGRTGAAIVAASPSLEAGPRRHLPRLLGEAVAARRCPARLVRYRQTPAGAAPDGAEPGTGRVPGRPPLLLPTRRGGARGNPSHPARPGFPGSLPDRSTPLAREPAPGSRRCPMGCQTHRSH
jgi:hypothetical protein